MDGNRIVMNEHVVRAGKPYLDLGAVRIGLSVVIVDARNDLAVLTPEGELAAASWVRASYQRQEYTASGDSYEQAAQLGNFWKDWCRASIAYMNATGAEDKILEASRSCIEKGGGQKDSDSFLADAHNFIAITLNTRGVYEEALSHAREAVAIDAQNASYENNLAESFNGLRRFQEAINAAKQAIRLSDGKYGFMHFTLGMAYFNTENWPLAEQSFEKAAQLDPKDDVSAYNVAICLVRQGLARDAANQYEEVLRRNPNRQDRQDLLQRIQSLRQ